MGHTVTLEQRLDDFLKVDTFKIVYSIKNYFNGDINRFYNARHEYDKFHSLTQSQKDKIYNKVYNDIHLFNNIEVKTNILRNILGRDFDNKQFKSEFYKKIVDEYGVTIINKGCLHTSKNDFHYGTRFLLPKENIEAIFADEDTLSDIININSGHYSNKQVKIIKHIMKMDEDKMNNENNTNNTEKNNDDDTQVFIKMPKTRRRKSRKQQNKSTKTNKPVNEKPVDNIPDNDIPEDNYKLISHTKFVTFLKQKVSDGIISRGCFDKFKKYLTHDETESINSCFLKPMEENKMIDYRKSKECKQLLYAIHRKLYEKSLDNRFEYALREYYLPNGEKEDKTKYVKEFNAEMLESTNSYYASLLAFEKK